MNASKNDDTYVPPFSVVKQAFDFKSGGGNVVASITYESLVNMIQSLIRGIPVNEDWYLRAYPDVAAAVKSGQYKSARQHFVECGYFEGRFPAELTIDEDWYVAQYPDVALAVRQGQFQSATQHFRDSGYLEGRLPSPI